MMFLKLAVGNTRKSFRDYAVYFMTLTFGVCIFYVFNSIESQQVMMDVTKMHIGVLSLLNRMLGVISWFISAVLGFLIIYANNFLVKRRKKEFGIYMTLGMERSKISRVLIAETALVGMFSLIAGLLLGLIMSQLLALVTANMLVVEIKNYQFIFSITALLKTLMYFGIAFVLVMIFNTITISKQKLIDLIHAERKNEKFKVPRLGLSVILFLISAVCLFIAYKFILENRLYDMDYKLISSIVLGGIGTFGVFYSLSGFFLKMIQQSKKIYLKNLNMFILRQINSKINTTYVSMTFVCLMIFLSICILSVGMGVSGSMVKGLDDLTPYDATFRISVPVSTSDDLTERQELSIDMLDVLEKNNVELSLFASKYLTVKEYDTQILFDIDVQGAETINSINLPFMKLSEYNKVLEMQGKTPITLKSDEYAINSNIIRGNSYDDVLREYMRSGRNIEINGMLYKTNFDNLYGYTLNLHKAKNDIAVIVPDNALVDVPVSAVALHIKYIEDTEKYEALCKEALLPLSGEISTEKYFLTKSMVFDSIQALPVTISYITIYIGIVFLISSAAILAIAQISEANDNITRYNLLRKIGTSDKMIYRAVFTQILIYFAVPLVLAVIHSIVGITAGGVLTNSLSSIVVVAVILLIYLCYFVATYLCSKGIVRNKLGYEK